LTLNPIAAIAAGFGGDGMPKQAQGVRLTLPQPILGVALGDLTLDVGR
jgi:hypothetical protein